MLRAKGRPRHLSEEELEKRREEQSAIADVAIAYKTVVLSGFAVAMVYLNHDNPPLLVWSIGFLLLLLFHSWSHHINQFLLLETHAMGMSTLVLLWSLTMFLMSFLVAGLFSSRCAGMVIVCVDVIFVAGYLVSCVANYRRTKESSRQHAPEKPRTEIGASPLP
jgi:cation transport ATPase